MRKSYRCLLNIEGFQGWTKVGDWGDLSFLLAHDYQIDRIAVVTAERWKNQILDYLAAGGSHAKVEAFSVAQMEEARSWLEAA